MGRGNICQPVSARPSSVAPAHLAGDDLERLAVQDEVVARHAQGMLRRGVRQRDAQADDADDQPEP
jgi:hypothetical protein